MSIVDIIIKKRDKQELTEEEIRYFIRGMVNGEVEDYQTSALLMAIFLNGMTDKELSVLTLEMAKSGEIHSFDFGEKIVDKHSSGGVGDKTTLVISPIVSALGLPIAKLSGRGLGFTGGTIDKLESIPGFRTELSTEEFEECVRKDGIALVGQSADVAPADKIMYALRDVTGTVDSIVLIASSIMSKKLADGSDAIVLDVKTGSGAFMKTVEEAKELARTMVAIGENNGKKTIALVTNMNQPLGVAVGNTLEVLEAIETLNGGGPEDFVEECIELSVQMLLAGEKFKDPKEAREAVIRVLNNKEALEKFIKMVENQGGDPDYIRHPEKFERAKYTGEFKAERKGYVAAMDTEGIGKISLELGAGRKKTSDKIDHAVGLEVFKKIADPVEEGDVLMRIHANSEEDLKQALESAKEIYRFSDEKVEKEPTIYAIITKEDLR